MRPQNLLWHLRRVLTLRSCLAAQPDAFLYILQRCDSHHPLCPEGDWQHRYATINVKHTIMHCFLPVYGVLELSLCLRPFQLHSGSQQAVLHTESFLRKRDTCDLHDYHPVRSPRWPEPTSQDDNVETAGVWPAPGGHHQAPLADLLEALQL